MGLITKTKTWVDNENVLYTDINADFDALYNEVNGNLDNNNIKTSAAIDITKISGTAVNLAAVQELTNKTLTKPQVKGSYQAVTSDADAAVVTFDLSASNIHKTTLGGNRTLALTNVTVGQSFVIRLTQDVSGNRTVTWFSGIIWPNGVVPTLSTGAGKVDSFGFMCTGTNTFDGFVLGQNMA